MGTNLPFAHYHGGVHVAVGDVNGDGQAELIVSEVTGPSIAIYSTQRQRLASFQPRGATFTQGWNIAVGDIDGDGTAEILATPNISASTHKILVLSGTGHEIRSLKVSGFSTSSAIDLQVIDLTGDGKVELLTSLQHGATNIRSWSPTGTLLQRLTVSGTTMQSLGILLN